MEWVKDVILLLLWLITVFMLIRSEIRKKDKYATNESLAGIDTRLGAIEKSRGMDPSHFAEHCRKCREEWRVHDADVMRTIKDVKERLERGERKFTTLGVIQVAMCKHINMPKEDIEAFKEAVYNGTDLKNRI